MKERKRMLEFQGLEYELVDRHHVQPAQDVRTRTVQVEVKETQRRVVEIEVPIDMKEEAAEDILALMYDQSYIIIDGDDNVDNVEVNLL